MRFKHNVEIEIGWQGVIHAEIDVEHSAPDPSVGVGHELDLHTAKVWCYSAGESKMFDQWLIWHGYHVSLTNLVCDKVRADFEDRGPIWDELIDTISTPGKGPYPGWAPGCIGEYNGR